MRHQLATAALVLAAAGWGAGAVAQPVYRCGDSYSQQPCAGGSQVQAADPRTASQQSEARAAARRDAKAADAMEKARLKEEAKPAQVYIPPAKTDEENSKPGRSVKQRTPEVFKAVAPNPAKQPSAKKKKTKKAG